MSKKEPSSPRDWALFLDQSGPIKRLYYDGVEPKNKRIAPVPRLTRQDEDQVLVDMLSDYFEPADLDTGEELYYCRDGLQHSVLRKLRRGQFRVGAALDLHGMSVAIARQALSGFLQRAKSTRLSCVKIIHGKGKRSRHKGPVLKNKVNLWLRQREDVLAFCSARPNDGGTGAIYLLLKS